MSGDKVTERGCAAVRLQTMSLLAGDVSAIEQERLRAHLSRCETCRTTVDETAALMAATRAERYLPSPSIKDAVFETVLERIRATERRTPVQSSRMFGGGALRIGAGAAAAAVIAVLTAVLLFGKSPEIASSSALAPDSPATASIAPGGLIAESAAPNLLLGKTEGSLYRAERNGDEQRVTVSEGTLWMRFKPTADIRRLTVVGPDVTVYVTGTVLMLRASPGAPSIVGVLSGSVRAVPTGGEAVSLGAGEEMTVVGGQPTPMPPERKEQAVVWLAKLLDAGEEKHAETSDETPAQERLCDTEVETSPTAAGSAVDATGKRSAGVSDAEALYREAERKMARGEWAAAARLLEQVITTAPRSDRADTARLELSRIYVGQLNKPCRAAAHLKIYLKNRPNAPEAPLLRRRLCGLLPAGDRSRPAECMR